MTGKVFEVLASGDKVTQIHERDGEIVMLLRRLEAVLNVLQLLIAYVDMNLGSICQFADSGFDHLLEKRLGFIELLRLQEPESLLIPL